MNPLEIKITYVGNSSVLVIPAVARRLFDWDVGTVVRARIIKGGRFHELELKKLGGGVGIILPAEIMEEHGLERGSVVSVPLHEWEVLRHPSRRDGNPGPIRANKKIPRRQ